MGFLRGKGPATIASAVRACLAAFAAITAGAAQSRGGAEIHELRHSFAAPHSPLELRRRLAAFDAARIPLLFRIAAEGRLPAAAEGEESAGEAVADEDRRVLREALAARPRREIVAFLEDLSFRPLARAASLEGQRLLASVGMADHLKLLVRLSAPGKERPLVAPELRAGFESALTAILRRDPGALAEVPMLFSESSPGLGSSIVGALTNLATPESTALLASLLGRAPGLDALLLTRIAERGRLRSKEDRPVLDAVRRYLRQRDPVLVAAAARTAGQIGDDEAVEALVGLMEHADERVRASAFTALERISGLAFGADPVRWTSWYNDELGWWDTEAEARLVSIERGRGLEFVRAAREVLEHRLYRDRQAESFVAALERSDAAEMLLACRALGQLGSPVAVRALVACLERHGGPVREAAWRALRAITGLDLPPEADSWAALAI
jgi:hypothetical protein